jgi:spore germination cell wall hydrolase CwlJ-like protein
VGLLRRRIDCIPFESEFQATTFRYAKCAAGALAAMAVVISAFDLTNIAIVEPAISIIDKNAQSFTAVPERVRSEVDRVLHLAWRSVAVGTLKEKALDATLPSAATTVVSAPADASPLRDVTPAPSSNLLRARLQSPAERLHLTASSRIKAQRCLAHAIYFEARDEPIRGQIAVAQVVINRVFSGFYPNDLCDVVYQNASRHLNCQFTFACDGKHKVINERGAWARAQQIAAQVLAGDLYEAAIGSSTHYHALYVRPDWVQEMKKLARYGTHNFYRPVAWGNGNDAPVWGIVPLPPDKSKAQ